MTKIRDIDDMAYEIEEISRKIHALLRGRPPNIQGGILADLTSMWLAGHNPEARAQLFADWIKLVRDFVPESEKQIFGPEGHPGRRGRT